MIEFLDEIDDKLSVVMPASILQLFVKAPSE